MAPTPTQPAQTLSNLEEYFFLMIEAQPEWVFLPFELHENFGLRVASL